MSQIREDCLQKSEKKQLSPQDIMKQKDINKKVMMIRRKKLLQQKINPGLGMNSVFEAKLRILKKNNRNLAKALSDQKIETNHWYAETIVLKGELQEAHEKLLRVRHSDTNVECVFEEAEKQIRECYKSIDKEFNLALERIVNAVEKLTKAKQLAGSTFNIMQFPSQTQLNTFSRLSGSRTPLGASGVTSPRQRAVLPMVSGHVLQPAMVPLPKLKMRLIATQENCIRVQEESSMDMSTIGEQSPVENGDVSEEQQFQGSEHHPQGNIDCRSDDTVLESPSQSGTHAPNIRLRLQRDTQRSTTRCQEGSPVKSKSPTGCKRKGISRRGTGRGKIRGKARLSKLKAPNISPPLAGEEELVASPPHEEDPLEGPSWMPDSGNFRPAFRGRYHRRRITSNSNKACEVIDDSATQDLLGQVVKARVAVSKKFRHTAVAGPSPGKEASSISTSAMDSQPQSHNHSCLESPTSTTEIQKHLEVHSGRKSKRLLKSILINTEADSDLQAPITLPEKKQVIEVNPERILHTHSPSSTEDPAASLMTENKGESPKTPTLNEHIEAHRADNNITCQIVTNMDITQPVSDTIIQQNQAFKVDNTELLQDECKPTQSKKRFFKTKEKEEKESTAEIKKVVERTPFDISMLNESVINLPPFSSTRTTEKENLQPLSCGEGNVSVTLRDVSVVLKDVIKESTDEDTPRRSVRVKQNQSHPPKYMSLASPKHPRYLRRTLHYPENSAEDSDEMWNPISSRDKLKKKVKKKQSATLDGISVDSDSDLKLRRVKSSSKLLSNVYDIHRKHEEAEDTNTSVLSNKTENTKVLSPCYVRIQRASIMEAPSSRYDNYKNHENLMDDLDDIPNLQRLFSENQEENSTEMRAASHGTENRTEGCKRSHHSTVGDATHMQGYVKENNTGKDINEPVVMSCCDDYSQHYVKETHCMKQICQTDDIQQEHSDEEHNATVNLGDSAKDPGFHEPGEKMTANTKESNKAVEDEASVKSNSDRNPILEGAEVIFFEEQRRKRRAACKITSYKEADLNIKMRRTKDNSVCLSASALRSRRKRGRQKGMSRTTANVFGIDKCS